MANVVHQRLFAQRSPAFALLADHLDAVLRHGEALRGLDLPQAISAFAGPSVGSMIRRGRRMETAVAEAHALELAFILRLTQAAVAARAAHQDAGRDAAPLMHLVAAATRLVDGTGVGPTGAASSFLSSRGVARDQPMIGEDYLVGGRVRLGDVMDAVASALDMMDVLSPQT